MSYYQAPGAYGPPSGYGGYPGQSSSPTGHAPGMGAPPGAPGMYQGQHPLPARPGAMPGGFQPPLNMPKFDLNAPVIRLGTTGPQKESIVAGPRGGGSNVEPLGQRRGLGMDRNIEQQRQQIRENMLALQPPKTDEILKTIFIGNITEGCGGDAGVEDLLRSAGNLRKWTRAIDADNKSCTFGFAEYEDSESLETAAEILKKVYVPVKKQLPRHLTQENGDAVAETAKSKLLVVVDEASIDYAENWSKQRGDSEDAVQFRMDSARDALSNVLARLFNPSEHDRDRDLAMQEVVQDPNTGEVITVAINPSGAGEDELSDIPAEMRETVAAEITAFRDRSTRRDMERLKREEEMEARERGARTNRLGSPPLAAPAGPGAANGIPSGPRGMQGAPSGPKGMRGVQIPKDYQNGVSFVNGSNELNAYLGNDDEDTDASDNELEQRRRNKKKDDQDKAFQDAERRWENRERTRAAAIDRERQRDETEESRKAVDAESMAKQLKEWDDDLEASRKTQEYYADRSSWLRNRDVFRSREIAQDNADRRAEEDERRAALSAEDQARGFADNFLDQTSAELGARGIGSKPAFKISLGAAAQKAQQANAASTKKKTTVEVENLLDVDEAEKEDGGAAQRTLIPLKFDTAAEAAALTPAERTEARRQLAIKIPPQHDRDALFSWPVKWAGLTDDIIQDQLRPFVEKRSMDLLGVVEEMMWDVVGETLRAKKGASELVDALEGLLEDETESFVRKFWRMVVFYSESEIRGLNVE